MTAYAQLINRGIERGIVQGIEQGELKGVLKTAKNLKAIGTAFDIISEATGLGIEEIEKL